MAALIPGLLLGAGSLAFRDITEGLGCLLGGFCFSMWLLVLRSGGLVTSTAGKSIFIGVFCLAAFALSLSHYTRSYGIIGSTSFAGATVIVLGIDCFSRAGLKEFWLYIWGKFDQLDHTCHCTQTNVLALNGNLFPLLTMTYPITRGMRVEIAGNVLLSLIGLMSQLKIWKIIQSQRQKKSAKELEEKQRQERLEEDIGRRLEEGYGRERADWEATYGDRPPLTPRHNDSGIGSEREIGGLQKLSSTSSIVEGDDSRTFRDYIEMDDLSRRERVHQQRSRDRGPTKGSSKITVQPSDDTGVLENPTARHTIDEALFSTHLQGDSQSSCNFLRQQQEGEEDVSIAECEADNDNYHILEDVSLSYPHSSKTTDVNGGTSSIATFATSNHPRARSSDMLPKKSLWRNISKRSHRHSLGKSKSKEGLTETSNGHDQGSQEAMRQVIRDDEYEVRTLMPPQPEGNQNLPLSSNQRQSRQLDSRVSLSRKSVVGKEKADQDQRTSIGDGNAEITEQLVIPADLGHHNENDLLGEGAGTDPSDKIDGHRSAYDKDLHRSESKAPVILAGSASKDYPVANLSERLPEDTPKIAIAYRTSEWAKHLNAEDLPEVDELTNPASDASEVSAPADQIAVPVNMFALQQTALNATPKPERMVYTPPSYLQQSGSALSIPRDSLTGYRKSQDEQRMNDQHPNYIPTNLSTTVTHLPVAQQLLKLKTRELRSNSGPLVESPIEEDVESSFSPQQRLSPLPSNTLIAKRDTMVRKKQSLRSSNLLYSSPVDLSAPLTPDDSASMVHCRAASLDDDDISLSTRRSLLQRQRQSSRSSLPTNPPSQHNPSRSFTDPTVQRDSMLAAWRSSLQNDFAASQLPHHEAEARRAELMNQKYRESMLKEREAVAKNIRDHAWDQAMRRDDMLQAHREVLRKMQDGVNRRLQAEDR